MIKRGLLFILVLNSFLFAGQRVLIVNKNIQYKEFIKVDDVIEKNTYKSLPRNCMPVSKNMLENAQYMALHYIRKNSIICTKDVEKYVRRSVKFDFGSFEVEKVGDVVQETNDFVKIKTRDGKIEKIYKDGHAR
eukprot:Anaeramoba_flamelloidesa1079667_19.p2 GENE.a1079667_19~~a1079667_19.p2  ORF type:complete len:134 (+),score=1.92 a1079667_19:180-581(+)